VRYSAIKATSLGRKGGRASFAQMSFKTASDFFTVIDSEQQERRNSI